MQLHKKLALLLQRAQVVNPQSHALRHRANGLEQVLALRRTGFRMHHYVGRNDFSYAPLDSVAESVDLFEACRARDTHRGIHKMTAACAAHADAIDVQHTVHARNGAGNFLLQTLRRSVQQCVDRTPPELRTDP